MEDISLHIMDIIENSIAGGASTVRVTASLLEPGIVEFTISDNGSGMEEREKERAMDPFYTTKAGKRFGLGLALFKQSAEETEGTFAIDSEAGRGTTVKALFHTGHADMKPFGDIQGTVSLLSVCHPDIQFELDIDPTTLTGGEDEA